MRSNVVEINNCVAIIVDGLFIHLLRLEGKTLIWIESLFTRENEYRCIYLI